MLALGGKALGSAAPCGFQRTIFRMGFPPDPVLVEGSQLLLEGCRGRELAACKECLGAYPGQEQPMGQKGAG